MSKAWIGIDGGKTHHWAVAVDETGSTVLSRKVPNDQATIEQLIADTTRLAEELTWAIDLTDSSTAIALALLHRAGARVVYVPGRMVNRAADSYRGEAKTDARDALVIADQARMRRDCTTLVPPAELVAELATLVTHRGDAVGDRARLITRLRVHLTGIFPGLDRALDLRKRTSLVLLARWQTASDVRAAGVKVISAHLIGHGARAADAIADRVMAAAKAQTIAVRGQATTARIVAEIARQILALDKWIKQVDHELAEKVAAHPAGTVITSMPGMGVTLTAEFLVATGDLANFSGPNHLAAYAGLAPIPRDSGRISGNLHRPIRYNRMLRRVFYISAMVAANVPGPSREYYLRKRAEGKRAVQAQIALARRRVNVLWAMVRDQQPYNPTSRTNIPDAA
ncbi:IS110 family transposase [Amycolatopsis acidicola]|uniref:IS110 family transposase n=1 Tax=Amycolatopsis acidicola TaxID=2596893 RepID=A0A5N0V3Q1_9PSEU|nr:IS110 family transposase [Amycolatopsis acidicola]KAA9159454.1 IS110 family transposase [Amycolatopsis acidicola]